MKASPSKSPKVSRDIVVTKESPIPKVSKDPVIVKEAPLPKVPKDLVVKEIPPPKVPKDPVVVVKEIPSPKVVKDPVVVVKEMPSPKVVKDPVVVVKEIPSSKVVKDPVVKEVVKEVPPLTLPKPEEAEEKKDPSPITPVATTPNVQLSEDTPSDVKTSETKEDNCDSTKEIASTPVAPSAPEISEPPKESSGTHSDSDIPSEHEPLYESDQSGFMSDKEGPKEVPQKIMQRRRKKKRELRSPVLKVTDKPTPAEVTEDHEPPPEKRKKRMKRRKTNRTGFPTIRRKKRKPKEETADQKGNEHDEKSIQNEKVDKTDDIPMALSAEQELKDAEPEKLDDKKSTDPEQSSNNAAETIIPDDAQPCKNNEEDKLALETLPPKAAPRPRGRPKKVSCERNQSSRTPSASPSQSPEKGCKLRESLRDKKGSAASSKLPNASAEKKPEPEQDEQHLEKILERVATGIGGRTRKKRDLSEESAKAIQSDSKRLRRTMEEDVSRILLFLGTKVCPHACGCSYAEIL